MRSPESRSDGFGAGGRESVALDVNGNSTNFERLAGPE
jgi:hypothetical protein